MLLQAFHLLQPRGWMGADSLCGSVQMPVFFLLSGFCLVLGNGKTKWDGCTTLCTDRVGNYFDYRRFFLNRIARYHALQDQRHIFKVSRSQSSKKTQLVRDPIFRLKMSDSYNSLNISLLHTIFLYKGNFRL